LRLTPIGGIVAGILHEARSMERFTISLDESLASQFDALIGERGYVNRSEAVRDLIRGAIEGDRQRDPPAGHCVANLSYIYNHHERELAERLTSLQHDHHDLTVAAMHSHLDHDNCLETVILKGATAAIRRFAEALMAERGVRHGQLNIIALAAEQHHAHAAGGAAHVHYRPLR
jgi:CopG family nickel-responsive transcriptional regulator